MQLYVPYEDLTVVAFRNTATGSPERLAMNIARAALRLPLLP